MISTHIKEIGEWIYIVISTYKLCQIESQSDKKKSITLNIETFSIRRILKLCTNK